MQLLRRIPILTLPVLLSTIVVAGCSTDPAIVETPAVKVIVSRPLKEEMRDWDTYTGKVIAKESVDVKSRVGGEIEGVFFKEGEEVEEDAALFQIDPEPFKRQLKQVEGELQSLKAQRKLAEDRVKTYKPLAKSGAASALEYAKAMADEGDLIGKIAATEAKKEQIKLDLQYAKIDAPIAGRAGKAFMTKGNIVSPSSGKDLLTTIVQVDPMYVEFYVDEKSLLRYKRTAKKIKREDIPVEMELSVQTGPLHKGQIDFVDNKADPDTGSILIRAKFPNPKEANDVRTLTPGLFARVSVSVSEPYEAMLVAERAVLTDLSLKYVLVVNKEKDNLVERVNVDLGRLREDGLRVIKAGLTGDEWVIVEGVTLVRPGISVDPTEGKMPRHPTIKGR